MERQPLIVGIDPGTTSAYALLDAKGHVIQVYSSKQLGLNDIIKQVTSFGIPLIVGSDKSKVPELNEKFAVKTGSRIAVLDDDLKLREKKAITKGHVYANAHEMDALASALYAYNRFSSTISKVKRYVSVNRKDHLLSDFLIQVIRDQKPIAHVDADLTQPEEPHRLEDIPEQCFDHNDYLQLAEKHRRLRRDYHRIYQQYQKLKQRLRDSEKENTAMKKSQLKDKGISAKKIDRLFSLKEQRLKLYSKTIRQKDSDINSLQGEFKQAQSALSQMRDVYVLKRLQNFGKREFDKQHRLMRIGKGDILYVEEPQIAHYDVILALTSIVDLVITPAVIDKRLTSLPFHFLNAHRLNITSFGDLLVVQKKELDALRSSKESMREMIKKYQERLA